MPFCHACGSALPTGAAFCPACGTALPPREPTPGPARTAPGYDRAAAYQPSGPVALSGLPTLGPDGSHLAPAPAPVPEPLPAATPLPDGTPQPTASAGVQSAAGRTTPDRTAPGRPGRREGPGRHGRPRVDAGPGIATRLSAYPWRGLVPAVRQSIAVFGAVLVALNAVVAVADATWLPAGHHGNLSAWLSAAVLLIAAGLGGTIGATIDADPYSSGYAVPDPVLHAVATLHVMPLLLTVAVLVPLGLLARREERRRPAAGVGAHAARAAASAVTMAALLGSAGLAARYRGEFGTNGYTALRGEFGLVTAATMAAGLLVVGLASFAIRVTAPPAAPAVTRAPMSVRISSPFSIAAVPAAAVPAVRPAVDALRLVARYAAVLAAGTLSTAVAAMIIGRTAGPGTWSFTAVATELVTAVSLVPSAALMLLAVPMSVAGVDASGLSRALESRLPGYATVELGHPISDASRWSLLLLIPILALVIAAVWHTLARPVAQWRPSFEGAGAVRICGLTTLVLVIAAAAQRITVSYVLDGGSTGPTSISVGPSLPGAALAGVAWGLLLVLAVRGAPTIALLAPRLMLALPGRVHPSWASVLVGLEPAPGGVYGRAPAAAADPDQI